MGIEVILLFILIVYLIFATISDIKTTEIPNYLTYSLVIIAFFLKLLESIITRNYLIILYGLIGFLVFFAISMLMYYTKQWGGGDAKIFMGIGIVLSQYPQFLLQIFPNNIQKIPFLAVIFINTILVGGAYGIFYSIAMGFKNKKELIKKIKELFKIRAIKLASSVINLFFLISILLYFLIEDKIITPLLIFTASSILVLFYIWIFVKAVETSSMLRYMNPKHLQEGDWIISKIKKNNRVIYTPKNTGIAKRDIKLLIKQNIKKVLVKKGIPFMPPITIAVIISLIYGNLLWFI